MAVQKGIIGVAVIGGTKCNACCSQKLANNKILFYTFWNPISHLILIMNAMFPDAELRNEWQEEGLGLTGNILYKIGKEIVAKVWGNEELLWQE